MTRTKPIYELEYGSEEYLERVYKALEESKPLSTNSLPEEVATFTDEELRAAKADAACGF